MLSADELAVVKKGETEPQEVLGPPQSWGKPTCFSTQTRAFSMSIDGSGWLYPSRTWGHYTPLVAFVPRMDGEYQPCKTRGKAVSFACKTPAGRRGVLGVVDHGFMGLQGRALSWAMGWV